MEDKNKEREKDEEIKLRDWRGNGKTERRNNTKNKKENWHD